METNTFTSFLLLEFGPFRILFRSCVIALLLLLGLSLPDFGAILDLIGATTITCLNFIFPPVFYLLLADKAKENKAWEQRWKTNDN